MARAILIIMGVSGSGKSTIGQALSTSTGLPFFDADDYHPPANVAKMSSGTPLTDEDRWPWLERLADLLAEEESKAGAILACSALKESYRQLMERDLKGPAYWFFLHGSAELIAERLSARNGHFMPLHLLQSQFDTLEIPESAVTISIDQVPEQITEQILNHLKA